MTINVGYVEPDKPVHFYTNQDLYVGCNHIIDLGTNPKAFG